MGERALEDQDCKRLWKGVIAKDLQSSHPTNASTEIHSGNNPKEPTTNVGVIWTIKNRIFFADDVAIIEK
jgi:hypothetical protein